MSEECGMRSAECGMLFCVFGLYFVKIYKAKRINETTNYNGCGNRTSHDSNLFAVGYGCLPHNNDAAVCCRHMGNARLYKAERKQASEYSCDGCVADFTVAFLLFRLRLGACDSNAVYCCSSFGECVL